MKRLIGLAAIFVALLSFTLSAAQAPTALRVDGVTIVKANGARLLISGINVEMFRDYRGNGGECDYTSDGYYAVRDAFAKKFSELGINVARLNYAYANLSAANLAKFVDVAESLMKRGIYVMPSDHTYTGGVLTGASASYPTMRAIIAEVRKRGLDEGLLIMNPFNEPGPDVTPAAWLLAQQKVLQDLRTTAKFDGLVVLDGTGWSTMLDVTTFNKVITYDSQLRTSLAQSGDVLPAKVAFSNHLYPNITGLPATIGANSDKVPLIVGEIGQINPGASGLDPAYVRSVASQALKTWMPKGHNGLFVWIANWCDANKTWEDWTKNPSIPYSIDANGNLIEPLSPFGNVVISAYYNPMLATNGAPPPVVTISPSGTPTRTASRTPTPVASLTPTSKPVIVVTGEFGGTPFSAIIEQR